MMCHSNYHWSLQTCSMVMMSQTYGQLPQLIIDLSKWWEMGYKLVLCSQQMGCLVSWMLHHFPDQKSLFLYLYSLYLESLLLSIQIEGACAGSFHAGSRNWNCSIPIVLTICSTNSRRRIQFHCSLYLASSAYKINRALLMYPDSYGCR